MWRFPEQNGEVLLNMNLINGLQTISNHLSVLEMRVSNCIASFEMSKTELELCQVFESLSHDSFQSV